MASTVPLSSRGSSSKLSVCCTSAQARVHHHIMRGDFPDNAHLNNAHPDGVCPTNQIGELKSAGTFQKLCRFRDCAFNETY